MSVHSECHWPGNPCHPGCTGWVEPPPVPRWECWYSLPPVIEKTRSYQPQFVVTVPGCTREDALAVVERLHPGSEVHRCEAVGAVRSECAAQEQAPTPRGARPGPAEGTPPEATPSGSHCIRCYQWMQYDPRRPDRTCAECRKELAWLQDMREGR